MPAVGETRKIKFLKEKTLITSQLPLLLNAEKFAAIAGIYTLKSVIKKRVSFSIFHSNRNKRLPAQYEKLRNWSVNCVSSYAGFIGIFGGSDEITNL